jgi:hypothetical protein
MARRTDIEMARARTAKITRSLIRLKHSLAADSELNDVLWDTLDKFDAALQSGQLLQMNAGLADLFRADDETV